MTEPDGKRPKQPRRNTVVVAVVASFFAALLTWSLIEGPSADAGAGAKAASLRLTDFQGERFALEDYEGTPLVVNFWASWCPSCAAEMPAFDNAYQRLEQKVAFVGINQNDDHEAARELARSTGVTYRLAEDPSGEAFALFGGTGMPTTVFIDREGDVVETIAGGVSEAQLLEMIEEHLGVRV